MELSTALKFTPSGNSTCLVYKMFVSPDAPWISVVSKAFLSTANISKQEHKKKKKELLFIAHLQRARPGPNVSHDLLWASEADTRIIPILQSRKPGSEVN